MATSTTSSNSAATTVEPAETKKEKQEVTVYLQL